MMTHKKVYKCRTGNISYMLVLEERTGGLIYPEQSIFSAYEVSNKGRILIDMFHATGTESYSPIETWLLRAVIEVEARDFFRCLDITSLTPHQKEACFPRLQPEENEE